MVLAPVRSFDWILDDEAATCCVDGTSNGGCGFNEEIGRI
jgi:hypothetical protein